MARCPEHGCGHVAVTESLLNDHWWEVHASDDEILEALDNDE